MATQDLIFEELGLSNSERQILSTKLKTMEGFSLKFALAHCETLEKEKLKQEFPKLEKLVEELLAGEALPETTAPTATQTTTQTRTQTRAQTRTDATQNQSPRINQLSFWKNEIKAAWKAFWPEWLTPSTLVSLLVAIFLGAITASLIFSGCEKKIDTIKQEPAQIAIEKVTTPVTPKKNPVNYKEKLKKCEDELDQYKLMNELTRLYVPRMIDAGWSKTLTAGQKEVRKNEASIINDIREKLLDGINQYELREANAVIKRYKPPQQGSGTRSTPNGSSTKNIQ